MNCSSEEIQWDEYTISRRGLALQTHLPSPSWCSSQTSSTLPGNQPHSCVVRSELPVRQEVRQIYLGRAAWVDLSQSHWQRCACMCEGVVGVGGDVRNSVWASALVSDKKDSVSVTSQNNINYNAKHKERFIKYWWWEIQEIKTIFTKEFKAMHMSPVQWESLDAASTYGLYAI